jgi:hypothetical protein
MSDLSHTQRSKSAPQITRGLSSLSPVRATRRSYEEGHQKKPLSKQHAPPRPHLTFSPSLHSRASPLQSPRSDREDPFGACGFFPSNIGEEEQEGSWRWLRDDDSADKLATLSVIEDEDEGPATPEETEDLARRVITSEDKMGVLSLRKLSCLTGVIRVRAASGQTSMGCCPVPQARMISTTMAAC